MLPRSPLVPSVEHSYLEVPIHILQSQSVSVCFCYQSLPNNNNGNLLPSTAVVERLRGVSCPWHQRRVGRERIWSAAREPWPLSYFLQSIGLSQYVVSPRSSPLAGLSRPWLSHCFLHTAQSHMFWSPYFVCFARCWRGASICCLLCLVLCNRCQQHFVRSERKHEQTYRELTHFLQTTSPITFSRSTL